MTFTPGQFSRRAEMYHQLGQLTAAGLPLPSALEQLRKNPPERSYRAPLAAVLTQLTSGFTLTESLQRAGSWLPEFDLALLRAGEQSGRLDSCFKLLGDHYLERARLTRQMLADLAYPVFLLHFAVFILPFAQFFITGDWIAYLFKTFGVLVPIYALVALGIFAAQSNHGESWRAFMERLLDPVPVLGKARRDLALGRLAAALEALLGAGVTIIEAWELAVAASGSPALRKTVLAWRPLVDGGQTPAEALNASGKFPELFANQYATGEISGMLEETLRRLHGYYQDEGTRKLHAVAQWAPRAFYLCLVLIIAYKIVAFYTNHFGQMLAPLGG